MDPGRMIELLGLSPHPLGGWLAETWREPRAAGQRPASTAIDFLLHRGEVTHWHRVDATEIWRHYAGDAPVLFDNFELAPACWAAGAGTG